jgi:hypothetical protein
MQRRLDPGLRRVLRAGDDWRRRSPENLTLRELAAATGGTGDVPAGADGDPGDREPPADDTRGRRPVLDEKQPDAPA